MGIAKVIEKTENALWEDQRGVKGSVAKHSCAVLVLLLLLFIVALFQTRSSVKRCLFYYRFFRRIFFDEEEQEEQEEETKVDSFYVSKALFMREESSHKETGRPSVPYNIKSQSNSIEHDPPASSLYSGKS